MLEGGREQEEEREDKRRGKDNLCGLHGERISVHVCKGVCVRVHLRMHVPWKRRRGCVHLETAGMAH